MDERAIHFKKNSEILYKYLPELSVPQISKWIIDFDFKLKIKKERSTRLGDYSSPRNKLNHVITINYNLKQFINQNFMNMLNFLFNLGNNFPRMI